MGERPILFSAPMVRALLAGTKTQTRRLIPQTTQDAYDEYDDWCRNVSAGVPTSRQWEPDYYLERSRIQPGDRLWVREAWRPNWSAEGYREDLGRIARPADFDPLRTAIEYLADDTHELNGKNRPGIHMPRWASRLTLAVTDVRVQRLQDISEEDAAAEGIEAKRICGVGSVWKHYGNPDAPVGWNNPQQSYETLWNSINGTGSWQANPWVAAYTFTVEHRNIDEGRVKHADANSNDGVSP